MQEQVFLQKIAKSQIQGNIMVRQRNNPDPMWTTMTQIPSNLQNVERLAEQHHPHLEWPQMKPKRVFLWWNNRSIVSLEF